MGNKIKKVLFISDGLLQKNLGIGKVSKNNLKCLQEIYGEKQVDVVVIESCEYRENKEYEVIVPYETKTEKYLSLLKGYYNFSEENEIEILKKIKEKKYKMIFIDNSMYGKLIESIKREFKDVEVIVFFHDVKAYLAKVLLKQKGFQFLKFYFPLLKNEKLTVRYADKIITLNNRENENLYKYYKVISTEQIPISLEDNYTYLPKESKKKNNIEMLFVGSDYFPNYNGIKWFVENVFPKLENTKLIIAGNGTEKWKKELGKKNVEILGKIEDLSSVYEDSDFVILPIFEGAGMKVKTAEALMYGKTILGSEEALMGYEINEDIGYCCNTAEEYIDKIKKIIKNRKIGYNLASRELYLKKYSFNSALESYKKILK